VAASLDAADAEIVLVGPDDVIAGLPAARHVGVGRWEGGGAPDPLALAGRLTGLSIEAAVRLWREGAVDAIVTGPGHKRSPRYFYAIFDQFNANIRHGKYLLFPLKITEQYFLISRTSSLMFIMIYVRYSILFD
jgi:hypothetical protein